METGSSKYNLLVEFAILIHKKWKRILLLGALTFLLSFILLKTFVIKYHSSVRFVLDESDPKAISASETERFALDQLVALSKYRMHYLLYSDEMAKGLDKDCELGIHYGLNKDSPEYFEDIIEQMRGTIKLNREIFNVITIEVTDKDNHYAAKVANAAFENLKGIITKTVLLNLHHKENIYNSNINKFQAQNLNDLENLRRIFSDFEKEATSKSFSNNDLMFIRSNLLSALFESKNSLMDLKRNEFMREISADVMKDSALQNLYLLNKAYPEQESRVNYRLILYSAGVSFVISLYYLFVSYMLQHKRDYIKLLISSLKYGESKI